MIDRQEALRQMSRWLTATGSEARIELVLLENDTLETEFGWVFFYGSKQPGESSEFSDAIAGNAPVIVDRTLGSLHLTGTARPVADHIDEFRRVRALVGLSTASFVGAPAEDPSLFAMLPREYASFLRTLNGCVVYGGGLHIRGICRDPSWHSLQQCWTGDERLSALYPNVKADDVPFSQDFLGDQFLIRSNSVWRLSGETGELEDLGMSWSGFFEHVASDPHEFLSLGLLERYKAGGACLEPGKLLSTYPPLCTKQAAEGVSLKAIPVLERIRFLADFSSQVQGLTDGSMFRI